MRDEFAGAVEKYFELEAPFVQFARWICEECDSTPMLRKIGVELLELYEKKMSPSRAYAGEIADFALQEVPYFSQHSQLGQALSRVSGRGKVN